MTTEREVDEFLAHFGVKGMRWGVRKELLNEFREIWTGSKRSAILSLENFFQRKALSPEQELERASLRRN